jgi:hypothetical protein
MVGALAIGKWSHVFVVGEICAGGYLVRHDYSFKVNVHTARAGVNRGPPLTIAMKTLARRLRRESMSDDDQVKRSLDG